MTPIKYKVNSIDHNETSDVYIEFAGDTGWAIRCDGDCLNKSGDWGYEPMPSSRDENFYKEFRYSTPEEALEVVKKSK